jgi:SAM-dependent methyltransferase
VDAHLYPEMAKLEEYHWWWLARRTLLKRFLKRFPKPSSAQQEISILEAGCGTGGNLKMLSQFGEVYGMELDDVARSIAINRQIGEIRAGRLPDQIPFGEKTFDWVVLLDVLEHLDDDKGALKALFERVKPGGHLLLTVPAYMFLWSEHDQSHQHKRRYVKNQLRQRVEEAGFQIQFLSYYNTLLFPLIAAIRIFKNRIKKTGEACEKGDDTKAPNAIVNRILQSVFASERFFLGPMSFPFGVSLIVTAKRPTASINNVL